MRLWVSVNITLWWPSGPSPNMGNNSQDGSNLDQLISRHKEALQRIQELKGKAKRPSIMQKLASHWQTHGNVLSSFLFAGCFVALASNLVAEREAHRVRKQREIGVQGFDGFEELGMCTWLSSKCRFRTVREKVLHLDLLPGRINSRYNQ